MQDFFTARNKYLLIQIFQYLPIRDCYLTLNLLNKCINSLLTSNLGCIYTLTHLNPTAVKSLQIHPTSVTCPQKALKLIRDLFAFDITYLPFLGFKSNTNSLYKNPSCWIDRAFIPFKQNFCSTGKPHQALNEDVGNFEFEGVISEEIKELYDFNERMLRQVNKRKYQELQTNKLSNEIDEGMYMVLDRDIQKSLGELDRVKYEEIVRKMENKRKKLKKLLKSSHYNQEIEIEGDRVKKEFALLSGIEINRGSVANERANPVSSFAVFCSKGKVRLDDKIVKIFDSVKNEREFVNVYLGNLEKLPGIWETNVTGLERYSRRKWGEDGDRDRGGCRERVKVVVFRNDSRMEDGVWPVMWVSFEGETEKIRGGGWTDEVVTCCEQEAVSCWGEGRKRIKVENGKSGDRKDQGKCERNRKNGEPPYEQVEMKSWAVSEGIRNNEIDFKKSEKDEKIYNIKKTGHQLQNEDNDEEGKASNAKGKKVRKLLVRFCRSNAFCCKFVMVKLISAGAKKGKRVKNIDFGYFRLIGGYVKELNESLTQA